MLPDGHANWLRHPICGLTGSHNRLFEEFFGDPPFLLLRLLLSADNVQITKKPGGVYLLIRSGKCESAGAASGLLDFLGELSHGLFR
jgi:hypothetical protein